MTPYHADDVLLRGTARRALLELEHVLAGHPVDHVYVVEAIMGRGHLTKTGRLRATSRDRVEGAAAALRWILASEEVER